MVSLWHAFDLAASLDNGGVGQTATPHRTLSRVRPLPTWLKVELLTPEKASAHEAVWRDLASRALIPNLFAEPEIALAAATHLMQGQALRFLFVWDERAHPAPRLILCAPLILPTFGVGEARLWSHELLSSSTPLIARGEADAAMDALLDAVRSGPARATGLRLPHVDQGSVFAELVRRAAARGGRDILRFERPSRTPAEASVEGPTPSHLRTAIARSPRRVREAVEHFLAIEALGPAGETGEALLLSPQASAFLRVVTRSLARRRLCHVELRLSKGKPLGADIFLRSGEEGILWKRTGLGSATSSGHSLDSLVAARTAKPASVDWLIAARPGRSPAILALAARDALSRRLRQMVKRVSGT